MRGTRTGKHCYTRTMEQPPTLITFDGDARSGKGTIVSLVKDYLRDERGRRVMLIDAGQIFRVLVVVCREAGVDLDSQDQIDAYLVDETRQTEAIARVKQVYRMPKADRETLLYSPTIGVDSAKIGARPLSQDFKDGLLRKWLRDARAEGFDTVLLDGRALGEVGSRLADEGLCRYVLELFFVCDPEVSAQRTLGLMPRPIVELDEETRARVDEQIEQIRTRNAADRGRTVQPVVPPRDAPTYLVSELPERLPERSPCPAVIIDRSVELPFDTMALPVIRLIETYL